MHLGAAKLACHYSNEEAGQQLRRYWT